MQRRDLLRKLLVTHHLNGPERQALGDQQIHRTELVQAITEMISQETFFPPDARPWPPGIACYEGAILEKVTPDCFHVHLQRSDPSNPLQLSEYKKYTFKSQLQAVEKYLQLTVSNNIDGLTILA